jgi:type IV secretory pathway VirB10-like protein
MNPAAIHYYHRNWEGQGMDTLNVALTGKVDRHYFRTFTAANLPDVLRAAADYCDMPEVFDRATIGANLRHTGNGFELELDWIMREA